jgi:TetR/AcrR family transcriptional regulator, cholesterol catabolism regulator
VRAVPDQVAEADGAAAKSVRTRMRVLDSAAVILGRKGYAGTRLSDIAAEASIQPSAIYYYF